MVLFGFFTGASLTDITNLQWRQIDLDAGTLTYARRKTGVAVAVVLHPELAEWIMAQPVDGFAIARTVEKFHDGSEGVKTYVFRRSEGVQLRPACDS